MKRTLALVIATLALVASFAPAAPVLVRSSSVTNRSPVVVARSSFGYNRSALIVAPHYGFRQAFVAPGYQVPFVQSYYQPSFQQVVVQPIVTQSIVQPVVQQVVQPVVQQVQQVQVQAVAVPYYPVQQVVYPQYGYGHGYGSRIIVGGGRQAIVIRR